MQYKLELQQSSEAKMSKIIWFQVLICKDLLFLFVIYESKRSSTPLCEIVGRFFTIFWLLTTIL